MGGGAGRYGEGSGSTLGWLYTTARDARRRNRRRQRHHGAITDTYPSFFCSSSPSSSSTSTSASLSSCSSSTSVFGDCGEMTSVALSIPALEGTYRGEKTCVESASGHKLPDAGYRDARARATPAYRRDDDEEGEESCDVNDKGRHTITTAAVVEPQPPLRMVGSTNPHPLLYIICQAWSPQSLITQVRKTKEWFRKPPCLLLPLRHQNSDMVPSFNRTANGL